MEKSSYYRYIGKQRFGTHNFSCKWGPTTFTFRKRKLPSGVPKEKNIKLISKDPTWKIEHDHFFKLIKNKTKTNFENDIWIYKLLKMEKYEITCYWVCGHVTFGVKYAVAVARKNLKLFATMKTYLQ